MAYTPGPWRALPEHGRIVLNGSAIYGVADITGDYANWNPDDLTLMAAAPELLAALRAAKEFIAGHNECMDRTSPHGGDQEWYAHCDSLFSDCKAAIAKAEGRE